MDEQVTKLVQKLVRSLEQKAESHRLMVGIGGIPGSGKTTLARTVASHLNAHFGQAIALAVPMDGYHYTRAQLDLMPDPATAHARRGAEFTFDGESFQALVRKLREPLGPTSVTIYAPSFDHAIKDPKVGDIAVLPSHHVIIFEGNYVALDKEPWHSAAELMDELWFVDVDFELARQRLIKRHVESGIAENEEAADRRARENDLVNGREIVDHLMPVTERVISLEDTGWVHG